MEKKHFKKTYKKTFNGGSGLFWKKTLRLFLLLFLVTTLFFLSIFVYYARDLPRPEKFTERPFIEPTRIYDRTGEIILYTIFGEEERDIVSLEKIPNHLVQAVISAEDDNFYNHFGVDFHGIARATLENIRRGRIVQGGSTISQQLIRSTFLTGERTFGRKIREVILTLELERRYSKDQIMEFYLNQIPFGGNTYGVEAASQKFFNKSVSDLTIPESAILAALIRAPSRLSPYGANRDLLLARKDHVLNRMALLGFISPEKAVVYKEEKIEFSAIARLLRAPHFTLEVVNYLNQRYGEENLRTMGLKIYTTIDWNLQQRAEQIIKERAKNNLRRRGHNLSLVAIDPNNGQILAMVGSVDFFKDSYPNNCLPGENCLFDPYTNVTMRVRSPGSAFKPFIYANAFKNGYNDETIIIDEPINIAGYAPSNFDGLFRGPVTIRSALAQSLNIPAVKALANFTSIADTLQTATNFGITTLNKPVSFYGLSLALGGGGVTLLEMTSAYGVFATEGLLVPPSSILKITDARGRIIKENNYSPRRVLNSEIAKMMNDILSDNNARAPMFGYNSQLNIPGISIKTGTSDYFRDGWAIGYDSSIVVGVWAGNNDNSPMINADSSIVAAPAWNEFFRYFLSRTP